jgi:Rab guanine nucleotide exchange factor SEC2
MRKTFLNIDQDKSKDEGDNKGALTQPSSSSSPPESHDHDSQIPPSLPPKKDSTLSPTSSSADNQEQQQKQDDDSFITPSEEIPEPPIAPTPVSAPVPVRAPVPAPALPPRPSTPSSIPLPESAANTPSHVKTTFPSDVQQRRMSTPPRSGSPANAALHRVGSPPPRTRSPAPAPGPGATPPPLPRRAAARAARPASMIFAQAAAATVQQRAASPARAVPTEDKAKDAAGSMSSSTPSGSAPRDGSRPLSTEIQPRTQVHEDTPSTMTTAGATSVPETSSSNNDTSMRKDDIAAASSSTAAPFSEQKKPAISEPDTDATVTASDTAHPLPPLPPVPGSDDAAAAPVVVDPTTATQAPPQPETVAPTSLGESRNQDHDDGAKANGNGHHVSGDGDKTATSQQQQPQQRVSSQQFVTDETWEERTWKELVRLREEMFWARIGGLRD